MRTVLFCLAAIIIAAPVAADCVGEERREASISASGIQTVRVIGRAGTLTVEGKPGVGQIAAEGVACASSKALVDEIRIDVRREGNEVIVEALIPEGDSGGSIWPFGIGRYARLDLVVTLPGNLPVAVIDGSGETWIRDIGAGSVRDGSGALEITNVSGNIVVSDGSGSMVVRKVGGTVEISDGSGSIDVEDAGNVIITADGSGSIDISNVRGNVVIENDGSGSISVFNVGGDFIVRNDGSGGIEHSGVRGAVRLPRE